MPTNKLLFDVAVHEPADAISCDSIVGDFWSVNSNTMAQETDGEN